jgi:peptidyl-dipeptidase Dcp
MRKTTILLLSSIILFTMSCKQKTNEVSDNPLLQEWDTPYGVPPFDKIKIEHYKPALEAAMQEQKDNIQKIIDNKEAPNFENTIAALEFSGLTLSKVAGVFFNLLSSDTNEELQKIAQEISPKLSNHSDEIIMNPELFAKIEEVYKNKDNSNLNKEQLRVLELTYRDFVRSGAKLNDADKKRLMEINERLSLLALQFGDNLLAETNGYKLIIDKEEDLAGLPEGLREAAAITAKENGEEGKWLIFKIEELILWIYTKQQKIILMSKRKFLRNLPS